jgi:2-dehydro-3-deoxyphosphooctonate aldolase (KDO 8-P synthase)
MTVSIGSVSVGGGGPLVLIAGPCVIESRDLVLRTAEACRRISGNHGVPLVFKSSFVKANRTSGSSFTGIGRDKALGILEEVRRELGLPVLTDIHGLEDVSAAAEVADVLQIPAFLCRQTDLLRAAGQTGRAVNVKKGQFLAPEDMAHAAAKIVETGNTRILLTERGATFGYHDLVVDMRALVIMAKTGFPVILDATHSVQAPGSGPAGVQSGGRPEFILPLSRAGAAVGIDGLFLEVHPDPPSALSDAASQLRLDLLDDVLRQVVAIDRLVKGR